MFAQGQFFKQRSNSLPWVRFQLSIILKGKRILFLLFVCLVLKGPKLEIFGSEVFTQIKPVWKGDLATRPKKCKILMV